MGLFTKKTDDNTKTTENIAAVGEGTQITEQTRQYLLEQQIVEERKEDPIGWAHDQLESFTLTPGAQSLMDRAVDNLSRNTGVGLTDEDAKFDAQQRAALINAANSDLSVVIAALTSSCEPVEAAGMVHSLLFNVLKSAVFIANLDYRNFLDPKRDMDLHLYVGEAPRDTGETGREPGSPQFRTDNREDISPLEGQSGFETGAEYQLTRLRTLYGPDIQAEEDVVPGALNDLRWYFQLISESFGWPVDRPMPFAFVQEHDGTFTPISDAGTALDTAELRRQASRAKRRDAQNKVLNAAAERAREMLLRRMAKSA